VAVARCAAAEEADHGIAKTFGINQKEQRIPAAHRTTAESMS
jgi:hypothetical protein